ncbi:hypothetical protein W249_02345 [Staphylococcus aureus DAR1885]|nr:hypothetical protein W249_02345 [Staphylococcus aureus DAR1885]
MTFEEKISKLYNEIANEISSMIPVEWEKVYTMIYGWIYMICLRS